MTNISSAHVALPTTNHNHHPSDPDQPTIPALQAALTATQTQLSTLQQTLATHTTLQTLYEEALTTTCTQIRTYTTACTAHTLALHKHYTALLAQSRSETIEAQIVHQEWQARLGGLSGQVREALRAREEEVGGKGRRARWGGLREENRVLRKIAGWEEVGDSDEEDEGGVGKGV